MTKMLYREEGLFHLMILSDQSITVGSQGRNSGLELEAESETKEQGWLLLCFLAHAQLTFIYYTDSPA